MTGFWIVSFLLVIFLADIALCKVKNKSQGKGQSKSRGKAKSRGQSTSNAILPNSSVIHEQTLKFTKMAFLHVNQQAQHLHPTDEFLKLQFIDIMNYNTNRYLLSRGIADISEAQVTCSIYGGYLAEMDDKDEFDAIRKFISKNKLHVHAVYIGVEDRERENTWTYSYSHSLAFTKFHPDEPDGGTSEGCVVLQSDKKFQMADTSCLDSYNFLCEIPEIN
ncbi:hypothetical protein Btru_049365 [Bulinus truncatus]|nr:hypothetical protein Btru_049365 [Bulinus truncatus]